MGRRHERADPRRRPVSRTVLRGFRNGSRRPPDARPTMAEGRVIYLSSFSKTLAPGFRVAWIDAPAPIAVKLEMAKQAEDLCTGVFDQRMVHECVRRGILERQLPLLRRHYGREARRDGGGVSARVRHRLTWPEPRGGFFLWATLPDASTPTSLLDRAVTSRRGLCGGQRVLRRQARREPNQAVVLRALTRPHPGRCTPACRGYSRAIAGAGAGGPVSTSFHWL